jgi:S1-C subfamily serine protease
LQYQDLTSGLRQSLGLPPTVEGIVVSDVAASSPLYDEGVGEGDIIVEVNGEPVADSASFERLIQALPSGSFARLYVKRMDTRGGSGRELNFFAVIRVP